MSALERAAARHYTPTESVDEWLADSQCPECDQITADAECYIMPGTGGAVEWDCKACQAHVFEEAPDV